MIIDNFRLFSNLSLRIMSWRLYNSYSAAGFEGKKIIYCNLVHFGVLIYVIKYCTKYNYIGVRCNFLRVG